jgi:small subunit ribosomal protein S19e
MVNALEVNPNELVKRAAQQLAEQKLITPPEWAAYVKTGRHKERPPVEKDWFYNRAAAVLRSVYKLGPVGTQKLRTKYGGRKNRGVQPEKTFKGSGAVLRNALQQLEKAGLLLKEEKSVHKGRKISSKGKSFLDKIAAQVLKDGPVQRNRTVKTFAAKAPVEHPQKKKEQKEQ